MSFKKILAPVASCCCAASSLVSPCKADGEKKYKRDDLLCYHAERFGTDGTYDGSNMFVVDKTKSGTHMPDKCKKCGKELHGTGYVVGHPYSYVNIKVDVDRFSIKEAIERTTNETETNFKCILCETCAHPDKVLAKPDAFLNLISKGNGEKFICPCCNQSNYDYKYIYKITQKEVPDDLWEDYGNFLIGGVAIFALLYGMLITTALPENAEGSNRKKGVRVNRQHRYEYEKNNDNDYKQNYEYENDDDENEVYA